MEFAEESYVPNDAQDSSDNYTESLDSDEIYLPSDVEGIEPYQFEPRKTITSSDEEDNSAEEFEETEIQVGNKDW